MASPPKNALSPAARLRLANALAGAGGPTAPSPDQMMPAPHAVAPPGFGGSLRVDPTEQQTPGVKPNPSLANALATPGFRAQPPQSAPLKVGFGNYVDDEFPVGNARSDFSAYEHLQDKPSKFALSMYDEEAEKQIVREVADRLGKAMGFNPRGGSDWSRYLSRNNGGSLQEMRVSNHGAFNGGSKPVNPTQGMGVNIDRQAETLSLTSPVIRQLYGVDHLNFPLTDDAFETISSPDSVARLKSLLESGSH